MSEKATGRLEYTDDGVVFQLRSNGKFLAESVASGSIAAKWTRAEYSRIVKAVNNYDQLASIARDMAGALEEMREEFRGHDLPYGSKAYLRSATALSRYTAFMEGEE